MRYLNIVLIIFLSFVFSFSCTPPPDYRDSPEHFLLFEKNRFYIDHLVFSDKDSSKPRLDIYIGIPSENILFKKISANGNYELKLTISVNITRTSGEQALRKKYDISSSFSENEMKKITKEKVLYFYNYYLDPGAYKLEVRMSDENAKKEYVKSEDLNIKNFDSENLSLSDLMILSNYKVNEDGTKEITPLITNNISGLRDVYVFFEIYSKNDSDLYKEYIIKIKNAKGDYIKEETAGFELKNSSNKIFRKILSKEEFSDHRPQKEDFSNFSRDDKNFGTLLLEIWDKQENKIVAVKKLSVLPEKTHMQKMMRNEPEMHR